MISEIVKTFKQTAFFCGLPFNFGEETCFTFFCFGQIIVWVKEDIKSDYKAQRMDLNH